MRSVILKLFLLMIFLSSILALNSCQEKQSEHVHALSYHESQSPSCTSKGNVEYWHCDDCGKTYADAGANQEIVDTDVPPLSHELVFESGIEATCSEDGCEAYWHCTLCLTKFTDQTAKTVMHNTWIPAEHSFIGGVCSKCNSVGTPELVYELSDAGYTVTGIRDRNLMRIVIPSTYNEIPVVAIAAEAFDNCTNLRSLEIGANVTTLPESFLSGCDKLIEIVNSESLDLRSTSLPVSVKSIDNEISRLENKNGYLFFIASDIDAYLIDYVGKDDCLFLPNEFIIGEQYKFLLPEMLIAKDFENSILIPMLEQYRVMLEEYCYDEYPDENFSFFDNESYEQYKYGCIHIGNAASNTKSLKNYLRNTNDIYVRILDRNGFEYQRIDALYVAIQRIIGAYAQCNPAKWYSDEKYEAVLEKMYRDYPITADGTAIYVRSSDYVNAAKRQLSEIIKTYCSDYTFEIMKAQENACGLERNNGYYIKERAFHGRDDITGIVISGGVTGIETEAFTNCKALSSVVIGSGTIDEYAFAGCESLENLTLNINVNFKQIARTAFLGCQKIKNINIGSDVFEIDLTSAYLLLPSPSITVDSENSVFSSKDGILYSLDKKTLIYYPAKRVEESFTVPGFVDSLGKYAFMMCEGIKSITIPSNVTKICAYAFYDCSNLKSVLIPSSVKTIELGAFAGCEELIITVDTKNDVFHASGNCLIITAEKLLIFGNKHSVIPSDGSVTVIAAYAFANYETLTEISIPDAIKFVMNGAFSHSRNFKGMRMGSTPFYRVKTEAAFEDGVPIMVYKKDIEFVNEEEMLQQLFAPEVYLWHLCRDFDNLQGYIDMYESWLEPTIPERD